MSESGRQGRFSLRGTTDFDKPDLWGSSASIPSETGWQVFLSHAAADDAPGYEPPPAKAFVEALAKAYSSRPHKLLKIAAMLRDLGHVPFSHFAQDYYGELWGGMGEPPTLLSAVSGTLSAGAENELQIESERLRTELIERRREVLLLRQELAKAEARQEKLIDSSCDLAKANRIALELLTERRAGRVCLSESLVGTVTRVIGQEAEVTYETSEGPLKQVYTAAQFVHKKAPGEGELVHAFAFIAVEPPPKVPESAEQGRAEKDDFRRWAKSKPLIVD